MVHAAANMPRVSRAIGVVQRHGCAGDVAQLDEFILKVLDQIDPQHVTAALAALPLLRDVLAGKAQVDGKATVYVCHNFTCSLPVNNPAALPALLARPAHSTF